MNSNRTVSNEFSPYQIPQYTPIRVEYQEFSLGLDIPTVFFGVSLGYNQNTTDYLFLDETGCLRLIWEEQISEVTPASEMPKQVKQRLKQAGEGIVREMDIFSGVMSDSAFCAAVLSCFPDETRNIIRKHRYTAKIKRDQNGKRTFTLVADKKIVSPCISSCGSLYVVHKTRKVDPELRKVVEVCTGTGEERLVPEVERKLHRTLERMRIPGFQGKMNEYPDIQRQNENIYEIHAIVCYSCPVEDLLTSEYARQVAERIMSGKE